MYAQELYQAVDFSVYSRVVRGSCHPAVVSKSLLKSTLHLVRFANTNTVYSASTKEEALQYKNKIDFNLLGYESSSDVEITYITNPGCKSVDMVLKPKRFYELFEDIALPDPPDEKSTIFRDFIADEFERIKVRAMRNLFTASSEEHIKLFGYKHLLFLEKLLNDARIQLSTMSTRDASKVSFADIYIMYVLNLFIIRAIVFYSKFLKPYLSLPPKDESQLRDSFRKEVPNILKYPWLFSEKPPLYCVLSDNNSLPTVQENSSQYLSLPYHNTNQAQPVIDPELLALQKFKHALRTYCSSKVFVNVYFQMKHERKINIKPYLDGESQALAEILHYFFLDKDGDPYNINSTLAILKPSNVLKRPNTDDEKQIAIKEDILNEEST